MSIRREYKDKGVMYIKVKVTAGSKKESFLKIKDDTYKIEVKELAERNTANRRVTFLLAQNFNLPTNKIKLVSGHHSPSKIFNINL